MTRKLIINADDYGMTPATVDGIITAAKAGAISSTSVMAQAPGFTYGVERLGQLGTLGIGLHLYAENGSSLPPQELKTHYVNQLKTARNAGIHLTHLDHHHHWIYASPEHFRVMAELAQEYDLPIRYPYANLNAEQAHRVAERLKISAQVLATTMTACNAVISELQIKHPDHFFFEFSSVFRTRESFETILKQLPDGISELLVHPGHETERQQTELKILLDCARDGVFKKFDIALVNFGELLGT